MHTESIDAADYAAWLERAIGSIIERDEASGAVRGWRSDGALLEDIRNAAGISKRTWK